MIAPLTAAEVDAIGLSLRVAGLATAAILPIAFGLAWLLARRDFFGKAVVEALVTLPLVLPPVVVGYLLLLAFSPAGVFGALGGAVLFRWTGAAVAAGVMALPLMTGPMRLALEAVDPRLEGAARTLGATRSRVLRTITLPLALPGIATAAVLGFARALGEFGATQTFVSNIPGETQTLPLAIHALLQVPGQEPAAIRLTILSIVIAFAALLGAGAVQRRAAAHRR